MRCYYKALPRVIPELMLLARPESEVILVSPWVADVPLRPPLFIGRRSRSSRSEVRLSELMLTLANDFGIRFTLVVRERDRRLESAIAPLARALPNKLLVREVAYLHAKELITPSFVLQTSANFLETSLYRNVESCTLFKNPWNNARDWLRADLGLVL